MRHDARGVREDEKEEADDDGVLAPRARTRERTPIAWPLLLPRIEPRARTFTTSRIYR